MVNSSIPIDLARDSLSSLHEQADWSALSAVVRNIEQWDESSAAKLDELYRVRMVQAIRSRAAPAAIAEFSEHLALAAHDLNRQQLNALSRPYFDRWRAWSDLLATRHQMLSVRGWLEATLGNASKAEILYLVCASGRIAQERLKSHFGRRFSAPYLTRMLNELEANLLVERQKTAGNARHNDILPGSDAPDAGEIEKYLSVEALARCRAALAGTAAGADGGPPMPDAAGRGPQEQSPGTAKLLILEDYRNRICEAKASKGRKRKSA